MSQTYIYTGQVETHLVGVGIVKPLQEVKVDREIINPLFKKKEVRKSGKK